MKAQIKPTTKSAAVAAVITAMALGAGCGDDDRLSKEETAKEVNGAVQTVNGEFQQVFELLGRREENERVPAAVRERLGAAAAAERREADEVEAVEPSGDAEQAVDAFVRAAGSQADALERAASQSDLTVAEMADIVELPAMRKALAELEREGLAKAPRHQ